MRKLKKKKECIYGKSSPHPHPSVIYIIHSVNQQKVSGLLHSNVELGESPEKLIMLDCRRTGFCSIYQKELEKLLREVALKFPRTGYYQGMNCIGGFLLKYSSDYDFSLTIFNYLVEKKLEKYFSQNFKNLKQLLFLSDKIFELYVPKFHKHFKGLGIGTEYFMSPIVLTLFTGSLQFIENYQLVANIIDIIIMDGWAGFFKVSVVIMQSLEKTLMEMKYDQLLNYLTKEIYEDLIEFSFNSIKKEIKKITIPENLLTGLEIQYEDTTVVIDQYWMNFYEKRRPVKKDKYKLQRGSSD